MKPNLCRRRPSAALFAALLFACCAGPLPRAAAARQRGGDGSMVVRVGVISYNNYAEGVERYAEELGALAKHYSAKTGTDVAFQLAAGSYGDVLDWYNKELIDIAFLTPLPVSELRKVPGDDELKKRYVASHATYAPEGGGDPVFEYGSVCVVEEGAPVDNAEQLKALAAQGKISFIFVDPLSVSGRLLPQYVLEKKLGITNIKFDTPGGPAAGAPDETPYNSASYSYGRSASADLLREEKNLDEYFKEDEAGGPAEAYKDEEKYQVAFFYSYGEAEFERLKGRGEVFDGLKRIPLPGLEAKLPEEVVLATPSFLLEHRDKLRDLFRVDQPRSTFRQNPYGKSHANWLDRFGEVGGWASALGVKTRDPDNRMFTLERIAKTLRDYEEQYKRPPRLALVLSGGGAKCAYQLGAIRDIEEQLGSEFGIDLVVGTSGGAINALTVALGLTKYAEDDRYRDVNDRLDATWKGFRQKDFFSPHGTASFLLALTTALLQAVLLIWLAVIAVFVARLLGRDWSRLYRFVGPAAVGLALLNALVELSGFQLDAHGTHLWWHLSLLLTFNLYLTAFCLAAIGLLLTALLLRRQDYRTWLRVSHTMARNALLITAALLVACSLFRESTLSRSDIVESTLADKVTGLVNPAAAAQLAEKLEGADDKQKQQILSELSKNEIAPKLKRDLIVTGSLLRDEQQGERGDSQLPPDLYFYHDQQKCDGSKGDARIAAECDPNPPADALGRFRPFGRDGQPNHLLDVVIGSSSIYPVFPSRTLGGVGDIVDGGFAHNSPVEAAWMWKATHIVLIEASPAPGEGESEREPNGESHLWQNAMSAFNHLYFQAQLSDLRAHGKVEMFVLRPEGGTPDDPGMCTFDFNRKAIDRAIDRGRLDAGGVRPRFARVRGEPVFRTITAGGDGARSEEAPCPCTNSPAPADSAVARGGGVGATARGGDGDATRPRRN